MTFLKFLGQLEISHLKFGTDDNSKISQILDFKYNCD